MKNLIIFILLVSLLNAVNLDNGAVHHKFVHQDKVEDRIQMESKEIVIDSYPEFNTVLDQKDKLLKIGHWVLQKPKNDLIYSFNYNKNVIINGKEVDEFVYDPDTNPIDHPWIMFEDGSVFDFSDIYNKEHTTFKNLTVKNGVINVIFKFKDSDNYPYFIDPSYGTGTIQDCVNNAYDFCNVTISSTVSSNLVVSNRETRILSGVTVAVTSGRLFINSSQTFTIEAGGLIDGRGINATNGVGGNGGSGGSVVCAGGLTFISQPGATNGNDGTAQGDGSGTCPTPTKGVGSHVAPFDHVSGSAGTVNGTSGVSGGGFYSTGAVLSRGQAGPSRDSSGGAGAAIKIEASIIQINGQILDNAGASFSGSRGASGGSGGGEVTLYSFKTNITGNISVNGANATVGLFGTTYGDGGDGGRFRSCVKESNSTTGSITALRGIGAKVGAINFSNGTNGTVTYVKSNNCFPDVVVNIDTDNGTVFNTSNPVLGVSIGVFNSSNVSCWLNADGVAFPIGEYNLSDSFTSYPILHHFDKSGIHNITFTCGNLSAGISNVTSELSQIIVNSGVQILSPTEGQVIASANISYSYNTSLNYPVTCNSTIGSIITDSSIINNNATNSFSQLVGPGIYNLTVLCYNALNLSENYSDLISFNADYTAVSILTPGSGSLFLMPNDVPLNIQATTGIFTNCNASLNTNFLANWTDSYSTDLASGTISLGTNTIDAICTYDAAIPHYGVTESDSTTFEYESASVASPFESAFGFDITSCPLATYNELAKCYEFYKIPSVFNFSAVVCQNLNLSLNYSCLANFTNVTKVGPFNINYTIYYTPSYWKYHGAIGVANQSLQLTGAEFIYNNKFVTHGGGMELIDNDSFMYVPAQIKPQDCGYFYNSTFGGVVCSYGYGFIVNNRIIAIADNHNQWYTVAGFGVSNNSLIPPEPVILVNVIPLPANEPSAFPTGMYTRYVCAKDNQSYVVALTNTILQTYSIFITTNNSGVINQTSFSLSSTAIYNVIPLANVLNITVFDSTHMVCSFSTQENIFVPFQFIGTIIGDGFSNMFVKIIMLFSVVLSGIVPYTLVITFVFNDLYHVLSPADMGIVIVCSLLAGIANNIFSAERGLKNMFVVAAMCISYLMLISLQVQPSAPNEFNAATGILNGVKNITDATTFSDQLVGLSVLLVNIFVFAVTLPITVFGLFTALINQIVPGVISTPIGIVVQFLIYGATIWYALKGYEVLKNVFRSI